MFSLIFVTFIYLLTFYYIAFSNSHIENLEITLFYLSYSSFKFKGSLEFIYTKKKN